MLTKLNELKKEMLNKKELKEYSLNFYGWFGGIIDGDGHFVRYRKKSTGLEITMELNDLPLLEYIRDQIGYGTVVRYRDQKVYRYYIHSKVAIIKIGGVVIMVTAILMGLFHATMQTFKYWLPDAECKRSLYFLPISTSLFWIFIGNFFFNWGLLVVDQ